MHSLLAIEWLKIKRYRTFWVLIGLFMVLLPLWNYQIAMNIISIGGGDNMGGVNLLNTAYSFPSVWSNMGFWASTFITFLSILVIIITSNEYTYRTHRQNVIDGWSRLQFFHAKGLMVLLLSLLATVYLFLVGTLFGWVNSGSLSNLFSEFYKVFYFFLLSVNYLGLGLFLAICIKRSGLAIGLFLLYTNFVEHILKGILNSRDGAPIGNLLPLQSSDELLPFQLMQMMKSLMPSSNTFSDSTYVIATIGWCAVYYLAGRILLLRRDW